MKSIKITLLLVLVSVATAFAQVPASFNYQAVVRNSSGEILANKTVSFRISLLQGSKTGAVVYSETHKLSTNDFGLVNLKIGTGTKLSGNFSPADWGEVIFTKIEIDPAGGSSFSELATSELSSVPFAFKAQTVVNDKVDDADADPTNEIQKLKLTGTLLELSGGGGSVTLPTSGSGGGDNWGAQVVKTDATLSGDGTSTNPLSVKGDLTDDQTLSLSGNDLSISNGNTITLPASGSSLWEGNSENIFTFADVSVGYMSSYTSSTVFSAHTDKDMMSAIIAENNCNSPTLLVLNHGSGLTASFGGKIKISDGTQGTGKVLTSDEYGVASWQTPATGGSSLWTESGSNIYRSSGNVGIGTTTPSYNLDINASDNTDIRIKSNSSNAHLKLDKATSSNNATIVYASDGSNLFFTGLSGDNNYSIKSSSAAQNGIQVANSGNVTMYNNLSVNGNVGIGTSSPTAPLEIKSNEVNALIIGSATANYNQRPGIQFKNNNSQFIAGDDASNEIFGFYSIWSSTRKYDAQLRVYGKASGSWGKYIQLTHNGANGFITTDAGNIDINPAGNVGIKTDSPTATLDVNGSVRFRGITSGSQTTAIVIDSNGNLHSNSSDIRLKENIKPLDNSLDKILKLRGVSFTWKANPEYGTRIGFIAQEFEKVIPELAFTNPVDGYKGINYAEVTAVLVESVKEQQKQIEALKTENNRLKADNNQFTNANKQITKRLERLEQLISGYAVK